MQARVTDLVMEQGRVLGLRAETPDGPLEVNADLVVGADGRHSTCASLPGSRSRISARRWTCCGFASPSGPRTARRRFGRIQAGVVFVTLDRGDYWQCAYVIPKGGFDELRAKGLEVFRAAIVDLNPAFADRVKEIASWDDVKLLTVTVDRLKRWYRPGLLCIGDAAHAMSPIGGVGINLAIQDAVAAANILWEPLGNGRVPVATARQGAGAPGMADQDDAGRSALRSEAHHQQRA